MSEEEGFERRGGYTIDLRASCGLKRSDRNIQSIDLNSITKLTEKLPYTDRKIILKNLKLAYYLLSKQTHNSVQA